MNTKEILEMEWVEVAPEHLTPRPVLLSDLIIEGARQTKFLKRGFLKTLPNGHVASCALGAAAYALNGDEWARRAVAVDNPKGYTLAAIIKNVGYDPREVMIDDAMMYGHIVGMVDVLDYTREQVATWLRKEGY